jgi:prepilin-type N-terminal cleavage/methylation domain-containing protein
MVECGNNGIVRCNETVQADSQCSSIPSFQYSARSAGFTLIELLVVLSIIAVIAGIAITSFPGLGSSKQQLRREARSLLSLFSEAHRTAMVRKMKVDVYVDESIQTVYAIESGYARRLLQGGGFSESLSEGIADGADSNRFFQVVSFPDEFELEAFSADEIAEESSDDAFFQPSFPVTEMHSAEVLAFSFTHFGGASGGGVSLSRGGVRLDMACDILTGRVVFVKRNGMLE